MDDTPTDYDHDAHAATHDARPRAVGDVHHVDGGYVPGIVSDWYAFSLDTASAAPHRATDGLTAQSQQAGRISDRRIDECYAPDMSVTMHPTAINTQSLLRLSTACTTGILLRRYALRVMSERQTKTSDGYVPGCPRDTDYVHRIMDVADYGRGGKSNGHAAHSFQRE